MCNEESWCLINPGCSGAACCCSDSRGAAANENPSDRIPKCCSPSTDSARIEAFRQGLRELGYVEGKNIVIEWRYAEGKPDRLPALAAELVRLKVDVIVTGGPVATRAAKEATSTIPIVMAQDSDPVGSGFVASLARPGGNITGLATLAPELSGKQLELLKEIIPRLSRVAVFRKSSANFRQFIRLNPLFALAPFQPNVPWPISIVPSRRPRSRTLRLIAALALAMSQAFIEILTAYFCLALRRFVAMNAPGRCGAFSRS